MHIYLRRFGIQYEYEYSSYEFIDGKFKNIKGYIKNNNHFDIRKKNIKEEEVINFIKKDREDGYELIYIKNIDKAIDKLCKDYYNLSKFLKVLGLNLEINKKMEYLYSFTIKDNKEGRIINNKTFYYLETEREELISRVKEIFERASREKGLYFLESEGDIKYNIRLRKFTKSNENIEQYIEVIYNGLEELNITIDCLMENVDFNDLEKENNFLFL
jgi:hypothetical protein